MQTRIETSTLHLKVFQTINIERILEYCYKTAAKSQKPTCRCAHLRVLRIFAQLEVISCPVSLCPQIIRSKMVSFSKILSTNPSTFVTPKVSGALITAAAATIFLLWKKQLRDHEERKKKYVE